MTDQEWLQQLKTGDEVFISGGNFSRVPTRAVVDRVTVTQIVIDTRRYRKEDGRRVGGYNRSSWLVQPTDAIREAVEVNALAQKAHRLKESLKIPTDRATLEALIAALTPFVK